MRILANRQLQAKVNPVQGTARWVIKPGEAATGVIEISTPRGSKTYELTAFTDGGRIIGYRLQQPFGEPYDIDVSGPQWVCTCADASYRQRERKHVLALKAALAALKQ